MGLENLKQEALPAVSEALESSLKSLGVDPAFVLAPEHRPATVGAGLESENNVPVIDLSAIFSGDESGKESVVRQVREASKEWGFFQVVHHGVSLELLETLEKEGRQFFALPAEEKRKVWRNSVNPLGYYDSELTKNTRDWKEVFDFTGPEHEKEVSSELNVVFKNQWPAGREKLRLACEEWIKAVEKLSYKILELLALSLGLQAKYFHKFFEDDGTAVSRINFYGKCPVPDLVLGVSRHTDQGALTVLVQDEVGGLEVKRRSGEWIRVTPRKGAFVINLGDLMQVWSNDLYHSAEHRVVVNENRDRFSCPYFMFPSYKSNIEPVKELTDENNPPKYTMFNWGEFDKNRKDSNFKYLGVENLQIHHYGINK